MGSETLLAAVTLTASSRSGGNRRAIPAGRSGYVHHIDVAGAQACLAKYNAAIWVELWPIKFKLASDM